MKTKTISFLLISILINNKSFGQLMTFGFVKNAISYGRTTVTDELTKKQYFIAERQKTNATNKLFEGATYYSNEKDRDITKGEIAVLSQIKDNKNIIEISFINGSKNDFTANYTDVFNQMLKFFKNEKHFNSSKFKTDVTYFIVDKIYYYVYTFNKIPVIVIANFKLEETYFKE